MEKKYIFFDIDGTLTDINTKKIIPSAQKALNELQAAGHVVALATGRAHYKARSFMNSIGIHHMVCNGGKGLVIHDNLISNEPLHKRTALQLLKEADALGYGYLMMIDDSIDVYSHNDNFRKQCGGRKEPTNYHIDSLFQYELVTDIYKLFISIPSALEHELPTLSEIGHLRFEEEYLMIQHDQKAEGIEKMMKLWNASIDQVVVFGDDENDLVMFDQRWFSIAMGNACSKLKEKADYVTNANVNDGIWNACRHFGWIK